MLGIFLDLETTGLDPTKHRTLEAAIKVIDLSTSEQLGAFERTVQQPRDVWDHSDPESLKVNGFTWEQASEGYPEDVVGQEIVTFLTQLAINRDNAVFIGQNSSFDRGFFAQFVSVYEQERLNWPYHWLDLASMYWAVRIKNTVESGNAIPSKISLSKNDIASVYGLSPEQRPHRAMNGVDHLLACYHTILGTKTL